MSDVPLAKVGGILLLVGAILSALGAVLLVMLAIGLTAVIEAIDGSAQNSAAIGVVYGTLAVVLAVGAVFGFLGFKASREGDQQKAFVFGLICALVPPVQIVPLLGAIFCKVAPAD